MNERKSEFIKQIAPWAMYYQMRTGIPASITISQAVLESGFGEKVIPGSNNLFGVKKGSWQGNSVISPIDHQSYRTYSSPIESIADHSNVLLLSRYQRHITSGSLDPVEWAKALDPGKGGYSTSSGYSTKLLTEVKDYNLHAYDIQAEQMRQNGQIVPGQPLNQYSIDYLQQHGYAPSHGFVKEIVMKPGTWSMPIDLSKVTLTSTFSEHRANHSGGHHGAIDLSTHGQSIPVYATEDDGKVVEAHYSHSAGNMITVEYSRPDGEKYRAKYMHLSSLGVKSGDTVNAGQQIGVSGNTGHSSGPHLHYQVEVQTANGNWQKIDPLSYLAEIQFRGNMNVPIKDTRNNDSLANYRSGWAYQNSYDGIGAYNLANMNIDPKLLERFNNENDPSKWLINKLGLSEDDGAGRDAFSQLIAGLIRKASQSLVQLQVLEMAEKMQDASKEDVAVAETKQESTENKIRRDRESINEQAAQKSAVLAYEQISKQENNQNVQQQQAASLR